MMSALGWVVAVTLTQSSTASARDMAAAFDPLQSPASVSEPRTSVFLEGGKDGKVLSGRLAVGLESWLSGTSLDLTLTGADFDESSGRSRVLQTFEQNPGGNLAVGLTWRSFNVLSYLPEIDQVKALCDKRAQLSEVDKQKALEKQLTAALEADPHFRQAQRVRKAREAEATELETSANAALNDPTKQDEARLLAQTARVARSEAKVASRLEEEERERVKKALPPVEKPCAVKADLEKEELAEMAKFAPPASVMLMLRGDVGAQRTAFFNPGIGTRSSELKHPWGLRAGIGIFFKPTALMGLTLGYREAREARSPSQLCMNQPVGGETTDPPTLSCTSAIIGVPTWSGTARARLEWRQYLDAIIPGAAWNPSLTWSTRIKDRSIRFDDVVWRLDVPVYFHLVSDKDKGLVVGAAYARYSVDGEPAEDLSLFLSGTFSIARL
ncbi:MAG TPA: hypothetical protein VK539_09935 [Myxococcaceae bacterium]|nr:hypothetical protein [Myxococcaceae bacterium]